MHKLHSFGQVLVLVLTICAVVPIWYWTYMEEAPISDIEFNVIDKFTWPGGIFRVEFRAHVDEVCPSFTKYIIVDAEGNEFVVDVDGLATMGIFQVDVPADIAEGMATYEQILYFRCNPIKEHVVKMPKVDVYVVS